MTVTCVSVTDGITLPVIIVSTRSRAGSRAVRVLGRRRAFLLAATGTERHRPQAFSLFPNSLHPFANKFPTPFYSPTLEIPLKVTPQVEFTP